MGNTILIVASNCCSACMIQQGEDYVCQSCKSGAAALPFKFGLVKIFGGEEFTEVDYEKKEASEIPMVPDLNEKAPPEEDDKTICGVLRKAYQVTESAEAKELIQQGVLFAKRMSAALYKYKVANQERLEKEFGGI